MSRGYSSNKALQAAVSGLGRELSRGAGSRCEICGEGGRLTVMEVEPLLGEPHLERAVLTCDRCRVLADGGLKRADPTPLRFLGESSWSEVLPVQLVSVRLLRALAGQGVPWALEAADGLWLAEEIEALV